MRAPARLLFDNARRLRYTKWCNQNSGEAKKRAPKVYAAVAAISQAKGRRGVFSASRFRAAFFFGKRKKYAEIGRDHCSCGRLCVGHPPHRPDPRRRHLSDGAAGIPARPQAGPRVQVYVREGGGRGRSFQLRRALHRALGDHRHGQHRRRRHRDLRGRPGRPLLDVAGGVFRHGDQVCGGPARRQVPQGLSRRPHPRRPLLLYRKRTRQTLEVPRRHLCRARHVRRAVRHRHLLAGQLHHGRGEQRV